MGGPGLLFEINALNCLNWLKKWGKIINFPSEQYGQKLYSYICQTFKNGTKEPGAQNYSTIKQICKEEIRKKLNKRYNFFLNNNFFHVFCEKKKRKSHDKSTNLTFLDRKSCTESNYVIKMGGSRTTF